MRKKEETGKNREKKNRNKQEETGINRKKYAAWCQKCAEGVRLVSGLPWC